jgi:DNA-binding transcriptional LysR family regulator
MNDLFNKNGFSLERLQSLVEVADAGGPTKAAKGDANKQSQFSRQIGELEEFFGVQLKRSAGRRGMELTPAGERLVALTRSCFSAFENFYREENNRAQEFVIAAHLGELNWVFMPKLGALMKQLIGMPVHFEVRNLRTAEIVQQIKDFRVHFGILRSNAVPSDFETVKISSYGYALYLPKTLLEGKKVKGWKSVLGAVPLATQISGGQFATNLYEAAMANNINLTVELKCNSFEMALAALRTGTHAAIIPDIAISKSETKNYTKVSVPFLNEERREFSLVRNRKLKGLMPLSEKVSKALVKSLKI